MSRKGRHAGLPLPGGRSFGLMDLEVIAYAGPDRLVLDDTSRFGLRRRHILRYGGLPDHAWLQTVPAGMKPDAREYLDDCGTGHLWIWWKPKPSTKGECNENLDP